MSKKKIRSTFSLESKSFNQYLQEKFYMNYQVYLPENGNYKSEADFEDTSILRCLDYAYGVGAFKLCSDSGMCIHFNPDDYSDKDVKRAGYLEPFDFLTHAILTAWELDSWKMYFRTQEMF